jgi:CelD/BcsL family acetyltransferase involved in cellulose biosynthesis
LTVSTNSNFAIEIASNWHDIADRWKALESSAFATPFQSGHWIGNWYEAFASSGVEPVIVSVVDRSSGQDLMIIPLIRRSEGGARRIEFADLWVTDYNAPLLRSGHDFGDRFEKEIWPEILRALPPADVLVLRKMPRVLGSVANPLAKLPGAEASDLSGHVVALGDDWEQYQASLSKSARRELRRRTTKFVKEHGGNLHRITDSDEAMEALEVLQAQQTARLATRGAKHVFNDPSYQDLYRNHLKRGLATGSAAMFVLKAGPEIVATFLALNNKSHCTLVRISQSQDALWKPLGLGKMIIHQALEALHAEGCRTFDLSVGANRYKDEFGVSPVPMAEMTKPLSWRGAPFIVSRNAVAYVTRRPRLLAVARAITDNLPRRKAS